jgi:hypothetical protein
MRVVKENWSIFTFIFGVLLSSIIGLIKLYISHHDLKQDSEQFKSQLLEYKVQFKELQDLINNQDKQLLQLKYKIKYLAKEVK